MNLNHLRTFAALADAASFSGAARRLGMPASTVSDHIAALEADLGLQLVMRSTRQVRLTPAGTDLAAEARHLADAANRIADRAAAARAEPAGTVRLSLPFALGRGLLAPVIGRFLADDPRVTVDLHLSNRRDDLIDEGIDLALRAGPPAGAATLLRKVIARAEQGFFAAPGIAARIAGMDDLAFFPVFAMPGTTIPDDKGVPRPRLTANDPETLALAAGAAQGVTFGPAFVALAAGLVPVLTGHSFPPADIALISAARVAGQPAAARLAAHLESALPKALSVAQGRGG